MQQSTKPQTGVPTNPHLMHNLEPVKETKVTLNLAVPLIALVIVGSGLLTGFVMAKTTGGGTKAGGSIVSSETTKDGLKKVVGVADEKTFKDSAEGTLKAGGTDQGEGTHYLERPGGISQNVYLTSSTVPLDDYTDKKVKVWGETFAAQTAGWFMDVGRLELQE